MPSPLSKKTVIVLLLLILLLGVGLRAFNVGHVLSWDEAWNVQTVLDGAKHMTGDVWFYNFYRHPPLYTGFGIALATIFGLDKTGIALSLEVISLLCALATMLLLFLCGRDWFDERVGLVAAFLYAVFPGARAFDVFIKPDSMTLLLGLLFLFFFFREKYLLAGVFLGLAFLAKETAVFIVIPAAVYVLVQWKRRQVIWLTLDGVIAVAMSAWWYLAYSVSKGDFLNFFIGRGTEAVDWKAPWHRYIGRLPADIGWVGVALLALAVVMFVWRPGEDRRRGKALLLVLWAGITYLFLTVSFGKPPWMIYTALPALALLGAWGLVRALRVLEFNKAAVAVAGAPARPRAVGPGRFRRVHAQGGPQLCRLDKRQEGGRLCEFARGQARDALVQRPLSQPALLPGLIRRQEARHHTGERKAGQHERRGHGFRRRPGDASSARGAEDSRGRARLRDRQGQRSDGRRQRGAEAGGPGRARTGKEVRRSVRLRREEARREDP
jgi:hypothetical protein